MKKNIVFEDIIDKYTSTLYNRAKYLLPSAEDAEDMVQEVFLIGYENYDKYKGSSSIKTWLMGILKNKVADLYRKKYKHVTAISLDQYFDEEGSWKKEYMQAQWDINEEILFNNLEFKNIFDECIDKIPSKWNLPFKMYYLENKKTEILSQEMGLTTTNIWKILQRGRLQLKECLEMNWFNKE